MRAAKPLTAKEKRYLDTYDRMFGEPPARRYLRIGVPTFLLSTGLAWWMRIRKFDIEGVDPASRGSVGGFAVMAGLLITAAVLLILWRTRRSMRGLQSQYSARYIAAGAEDEAPRERDETPRGASGAA